MNIRPMAKPTDLELINRFRYHRPTAEKSAKHEIVTEATLGLAALLRDLLPEGRNLSLVLTMLEDVRMRANAAIACDMEPNFITASTSGAGVPPIRPFVVASN